MTTPGTFIMTLITMVICVLLLMNIIARMSFKPRLTRWSYGLIILAAIALGICLARADLPLPGELELCYDRARWPEAAKVARRGGVIVANIHNGRGSKPSEARDWDAFKNRLKAVGGIVLGYVDFNDANDKRKPDSLIIAEAITWIKAGYDGAWMDDARDRQSDADVIATIKRLKPKAIIIGNPGTRVSGPLKRAGVLLCEHESNKTVNWASTVIIAFVRDAREAATVRTTARSKGNKLIAVELLSTYHVDGDEYQKENPLVP